MIDLHLTLPIGVTVKVKDYVVENKSVIMDVLEKQGLSNPQIAMEYEEEPITRTIYIVVDEVSPKDAVKVILADGILREEHGISVTIIDNRDIPYLPYVPQMRVPL